MSTLRIMEFVRWIFPHSAKGTLLAFCFLFVEASFATESNTDIWQWNTISVEKRISKRFSASVDEEIRFQNNITRLNLCYTNFGVGYKVSKFFKISVYYRSLQKLKDDNSLSYRHRFYTDLSFKTKWHVLSLGYRGRIQTQVRDVHSSENGTDLESYLRNKFDVKMDLKSKIKPYVAAEFRYQFGNRHQKEANYTLDRGRYYVGTAYKLSEIAELAFYYMLQKDYHIKNPGTEHVLGIALSFGL